MNLYALHTPDSTFIINLSDVLYIDITRLDMNVVTISFRDRDIPDIVYENITDESIDDLLQLIK